MKEDIKILRSDVDVLKADVSTLKSETELNRKFKHETNGHLHSHNGKISVIESQSKSIVDELVLIRQDIREWMNKTSKVINWQLSVKFMLVGGAAVGTVMTGGVITAIKLYLDYKHEIDAATH